MEEIFNECNDSQTCEIMLLKLRQKVKVFIVDLEHEKETIEFIKMEMFETVRS